MAYQSLYRKYRPQTFADVVGQGHVTRTIQNALESGRVGHGYLFTGTRGTAKTTVARLLAKALNCDSMGAPVREPCNRCAACIAITAGAAIDVIEMDAASHRGVADIEEVRKAVGYGPMELRYKVFIIDEAHQLSSDAKDAFLKTLEEPPANVVFILATTEPQSIPITIRSRCQQFDFKRGSLSDITSRLRFVLESEGVTFSPEALSHVARGAEGSYRDSLSLLEQVLAFSPTYISTADVNTVLGTLDGEMLGRVTQAIARRDAPTTFAIAGELLDAGKEARTLLRTLSLHFRDMLLVAIGGPAVGQELTPEQVPPLQDEGRAFKPAEMIRAMEILNEAQGETRWNNQHRLLVELTFLKLMNLGEAPVAANFITAPIVFQPARDVAAAPPPASLPQVERTVAAPTAIAPVSVTPALSPSPKQAVTPPLDHPSPLVSAPRVAEPEPAAPKMVELTEDTQPLPASYFADDRAGDDDGLDEADDADPEDLNDTETLSLFDDTPPVLAAVPTPTDEPASQVEMEPSLWDDAPPVGPPPAPDSTPAMDVAPVVAVAPVPRAIEVPATPITLAPAVAEPIDEVEEELTRSTVTLEQVERIWPMFLEKARSVSKMTETHMLQARPTHVVNGTVHVSFRARSPLDMMSDPKRQDFVRELLKRCLGVERLSIKFTLGEGAAPLPPKAGPKEKKRERDPFAELDAMEVPASASRVREESYDEQDFRTPARSVPAPRPAEPPREARTPHAPGAVPPPESGYLAGSAIPAPRVVNAESARTAALDDPLVQAVLSTFGGEIVSD